MRECSQRLLELIAGRPASPAPFWEPWFAKWAMLRERYGNDYLAMADDLGHAAAPLGVVDTGNMWLAEVEYIAETGAYYGGGALREPEQLAQRALPDLDAQLEPMLVKRQRCAAAGIACWMVLGWCFDRIAASMGLEYFALQCYDRPEFVAEAFEWVEARNRLVVGKILSEVKPDFVLYNGDCAYRTGPMIDPKMMRQLTWEPTRKTVQKVLDLGIPFAFHSDGQLDTVIPMLIEQGITAVHGCEKQANDLAHLVETFGRDITLCGNMDVVFLKHATPAQVRAETLQMLALGGQQQRFVAACNTSPQDYIPDENYRTLVRTVAAAGR